MDKAAAGEIRGSLLVSQAYAPDYLSQRLGGKALSTQFQPSALPIGAATGQLRMEDGLQAMKLAQLLSH